MNTPQSSVLFKLGPGIFLGLARNEFQIARLPIGYWNYAIRHVTKCKKSVLYSVTKNTAYEAVFGHPPPDISYVKPFVCRMTYQPPIRSLPVFVSRFHDKYCLRHERDGMYHVLTDTGIVRTEHVSSTETTFPDLTDFGTVQPSTQSDSSNAVDISSQSGLDLDNDPIEEESTNSIVLGLVSPPEHETDSGSKSSNFIADESNFIIDDSDSDPRPALAHPYIPGTRASRSYSYTDVSGLVRIIDEPKVRVALRPLELDKQNH